MFGICSLIKKLFVRVTNDPSDKEIAEDNVFSRRIYLNYLNDQNTKIRKDQKKYLRNKQNALEQAFINEEISDKILEEMLELANRKHIKLGIRDLITKSAFKTDYSIEDQLKEITNPHWDYLRNRPAMTRQHIKALINKNGNHSCRQSQLILSTEKKCLKIKPKLQLVFSGPSNFQLNNKIDNYPVSGREENSMNVEKYLFIEEVLKSLPKNRSNVNDSTSEESNTESGEDNCTFNLEAQRFINLVCNTFLNKLKNSKTSSNDEKNELVEIDENHTDLNTDKRKVCQNYQCVFMVRLAELFLPKKILHNHLKGNKNTEPDGRKIRKKKFKKKIRRKLKRNGISERDRNRFGIFCLPHTLTLIDNSSVSQTDADLPAVVEDEISLRPVKYFDSEIIFNYRQYFKEESTSTSSSHSECNQDIFDIDQFYKFTDDIKEYEDQLDAVD